MKSEVHLFIIWENAQKHKSNFLSKISQKLDIIGQHNITWGDFEDNLTRFYRKRPVMSDKANRVGKGTFTLIVVEDKSPKYEQRNTSKGQETVNINIFDLKESFRSISGPPNDLIHATNNTVESNHDLTLLLGVNCNDYKSTNIPDILNTNLVGYDGWKNISEMFYVLNNTLDYIVLRNWQPLPNDFLLEGHGDIDLLVDNLKDAVYILKAKPVFPEKHRVHFKVKIGNQQIPFDLRFVGDDYYDVNFEKDMLNTKVSLRGFNTPNAYYHFYSLLYHAFIHKHNIKDDYKVTLSAMTEDYTPQDFTQVNASNILKDFLTKHNYKITKPEPSVRYNEAGVNLIQNG